MPAAPAGPTASTAPGDRPVLVSFALCPYVQRAAIALDEKGVAFDRIDIDLADKPAWFLAISPLGRVPLLRVGGAVLFESAAILEYLDETQPNPMHPADPIERARHRAWIAAAGDMLGEIWTLETTQDAQRFAAAAAGIRARLARLEPELRGPWFAGDRFSLVDAVFAPAFRYFEVLDAIAPTGVFADLPRIAAWRDRLAARPSVRRAVAADYPDRLRAFLRGQQSHLAGLMPAP